MLFPLYDNARPSITPHVTRALVASNVVAWLLVQQLGFGTGFVSSVCKYGLIPLELFGGVPSGGAVIDLGGAYCLLSDGSDLHTLVTSQFMHGGWSHLIFNMWFLWIFGDNVEDALGHVKFLVFYLLCGVVAGLGQSILNFNSAAPMVGASGAIAGVMGAYLILFPRAKVKTLVFVVFIFFFMNIPAFVLVGIWLLTQFFSTVTGAGAESGVAYAAHFFGALAGIGLGVFLKKRNRVIATFKADNWE